MHGPRGEEREEVEVEAIESVESNTGCSLWEQKTKTKVREMQCCSELTDVIPGEGSPTGKSREAN